MKRQLAGLPPCVHDCVLKALWFILSVQMKPHSVCRTWPVLGLVMASVGAAWAAEPRYDRVVDENPVRVYLDLKPQRLKIGAPKDTGDSEPLQPSLVKLKRALTMIPGALLLQKAKVFDDGLYAAVEVAAQRGCGNFASRTNLWAQLAQESARSGGTDEPLTTTGTLLAVAAALGQTPIELSPQRRKQVEASMEAFLADPMRSKPLGFYPWTDELSRCYRQHKRLQAELGEVHNAGLEQLVELLRTHPELAESYTATLGLQEKLTNPLAFRDLRPLLGRVGGDPAQPAENIAIWPPSRSPEGELLKKLLRDDSAPAVTNLMEEVLKRVQNGRLDLRPRADSGWYGHQLWSLEALIRPKSVPEAERVEFSKDYSKRLEELFKGAYALTRETHVGALECYSMGIVSGPARIEVSISPELSVEPLMTCYGRRADSYRFVRQVIETRFGLASLASIRRLTPDGPVTADLGTELTAMEQLFRGAQRTVARELGFAAAPPGTLPGDEAYFQAWRNALKDDADLWSDQRMLVPISHDQSVGRTRVWAFLGWRITRLGVGFAHKPRVVKVECSAPKLKYDLKFGGAGYLSAYPVTAEVWVSKLLNREEFRAHCDKYKTKAAILANLQ